MRKAAAAFAYPLILATQAVRKVAVARALAADRQPVFALSTTSATHASSASRIGRAGSPFSQLGCQDLRSCSVQTAWQALLRSASMPDEVIEWASASMACSRIASMEANDE